MSDKNLSVSVSEISRLLKGKALPLRPAPVTARPEPVVSIDKNEHPDVSYQARKVHEALVDRLGVDLAGDFNIICGSGFEGPETMLAYRLSGVATGTGDAYNNFDSVLSNSILPILKQLRDRIEGTIERINARYAAAA